MDSVELTFTGFRVRVNAAFISSPRVKNSSKLTEGMDVNTTENTDNYSLFIWAGYAVEVA